MENVLIYTKYYYNIILIGIDYLPFYYYMMNSKEIVFLLLMIIIWILYIRINLTKKIIEVPNSVKCLFKYPSCDEADIDGHTIVYGMIYMLIGVMVPNKHIWAILFAISIESIKPYFGITPKYIINPLIGVTGYSLGSYFNHLLPDKKYKLKKKYSLLSELS